MEANMVQESARNVLEKEASMVKRFVAIVNETDLDADIKKGWLTSFENHQLAHDEYAAADQTKLAALVKGELELLSRLKAQIPNPPTNIYEKCWLGNIAGDEAILKKM